MEDKIVNEYFYKDEFGNYVISEFEDLGFNLDFEELNLLTKSLNIIGNSIENLEKKNRELQDKVDKVKDILEVDYIKNKNYKTVDVLDHLKPIYEIIESSDN